MASFDIPRPHTELGIERTSFINSNDTRAYLAPSPAGHPFLEQITEDAHDQEHPPIGTFVQTADTGSPTPRPVTEATHEIDSASPPATTSELSDARQAEPPLAPKPTDLTAAAAGPITPDQFDPDYCDLTGRIEDGGTGPAQARNVEKTNGRDVLKLDSDHTIALSEDSQSLRTDAPVGLRLHEDLADEPAADTSGTPGAISPTTRDLSPAISPAGGTVEGGNHGRGEEDEAVTGKAVVEHQIARSVDADSTIDDEAANATDRHNGDLGDSERSAGVHDKVADTDGVDLRDIDVAVPAADSAPKPAAVEDARIAEPTGVDVSAARTGVHEIETSSDHTQVEISDSHPLPDTIEPEADEKQAAWKRFGSKAVELARPTAMPVVLTGLILAPPAAGIIAMNEAPPAKVFNVGLDNLTVSADLRVGSDATDINLGVIGGLRRPAVSILGKSLGIELTPNDMNVSLQAIDGARNEQTIEVGGHLLADERARTAEEKRLVHSIVQHYEDIGFGALYGVALLETAGYIYVKHRRRVLAGLTEEQRQLARYDRRIERRVIKTASIMAIMALIADGSYIASPATDHSMALGQHTPAAGTVFNGWDIVGPFSDQIDAAIQSAEQFASQEQQFIATVDENRKNAMLERFGSKTLAKVPGVKRIVLMDDLQGNGIMAEEAGKIANIYNADAIINLGDLTTTGSVEESYLQYLKHYTVGLLAQYAGKIPVYTSLGRHDTDVVAKYAGKVRMIVADGKVQTISGLEAIGFNSPYAVTFGERPHLKDPRVTPQTVANQLVKNACENPQTAIVYGHDEEDMGLVNASDCTIFSIGGHSYEGEPTTVIRSANGNTYRIVLGSTGGHGFNDGPGGISLPVNDAPVQILEINTVTGAVSIDTNTVHPDGSYTIDHTDYPKLSKEQLALVH